MQKTHEITKSKKSNSVRSLDFSSPFNPFLMSGIKHEQNIAAANSISLCGTLKTAKSTVKSFQGNFRPEFSQWISDNWHIWEAFCNEAETVWASGRRSYSARTIIEFIRHDTAMREVDGGYKINNSYVPDLGRLYGMMNKKRCDFFECRTMANPIVRRVIRSPVGVAGPAMARPSKMN